MKADLGLMGAKRLSGLGLDFTIIERMATIGALDMVRKGFILGFRVRGEELQWRSSISDLHIYLKRGKIGQESLISRENLPGTVFAVSQEQ